MAVRAVQELAEDSTAGSPPPPPPPLLPAKTGPSKPAVGQMEVCVCTG